MGQTLDKPITVKNFGKGQGNGQSYGLCSMQGWRLDMEDAHTSIPCLSDNFSSCSYYAVFDGHAGYFTSDICSQRLHETVLKHLVDNNVDITTDNLDDNDTADKYNKIIRDAFVEFDDDLKISGPYKSLQESCGTTAIGVFLTPNHIIFCNCGDSRGFLSRDNEVLFQTKDHKPSDPDERARIEASGGGVVMDRVNGNLAVSRALGDFSFKDKAELDSRKQAVSPEPCVTILKRNNDNFIVLACDGIWDVMTCEEVRSFVQLRMTTTDDMSIIASELIDTCLMKDSRDNMSVVIIALENAPKVCETELENEKIFEEQIRNNILEFVKTSNNTFNLCTTVQHLATKQYHTCSSSKVGVYAKLKLIESTLDSLAPKRNRDRDYSSGSFLNNIPMAMQAMQSLVKTGRYEEDCSSRHVASPCDDLSDPDENMP